MIRMDNIQVIRSNWRTIFVEIKPNLQVLVRAPLRMRNEDIQRFLWEKRAWLEKHLRTMEEQRGEAKATLTGQAQRDIPRRVAKFAPIVGVTVGRITIQHQKTRWGSCSVKGNLNFNCLLMLCPEKVRDYVVVHELCHRKELNHSAAFWRHVEHVMPEYKDYYLWLKQHGGENHRKTEGMNQRMEVPRWNTRSWC